jgi:hypothetical protein
MVIRQIFLINDIEKNKHVAENNANNFFQITIFFQIILKTIKECMVTKNFEA